MHTWKCASVCSPTSPLSLPSWYSDSHPEPHSATVIHGSDSRQRYTAAIHTNVSITLISFIAVRVRLWDNWQKWDKHQTLHILSYDISVTCHQGKLLHFCTITIITITIIIIIIINIHIYIYIYTHRNNMWRPRLSWPRLRARFAHNDNNNNTLNNDDDDNHDDNKHINYTTTTTNNNSTNNNTTTTTTITTTNKDHINSNRISSNSISRTTRKNKENKYITDNNQK